MSRPSKHDPITKSYAIDQITDIEYLRKVTHRMWEAFAASHAQHAHSLSAVVNGECRECYDHIYGESETGCEQNEAWQRKVTEGFGSI